MVAGIRRLYPKIPILLTCDDVVEGYISTKGFKHIAYDVFDADQLLAAGREYVTVMKHNDFHRVDCIALKMDCLERAVEAYGDTMFLDADVVLVRPVHQDVGGDVTLSPHFHAERARAKNGRIYGIFNAGYLWTNQSGLSAVWRKIYKERSTFYEQQGMVWIMEHFDVKQFDRNHNVGFWRFPIDIHNWPTKKRRVDVGTWDWSKTKSIHAHVTDQYASTADQGLTEVYHHYKEIVLQVLASEAPELLRHL